MPSLIFRPLLEWGQEELGRLNEILISLARSISRLSLLPQAGTLTNNAKPLSLDAIWVRYTSNGVANTEDTVPHGLNRVPVGYIVAGQNAAASVYNGLTAWTTTNLYLRTSAASVAWVLLVF